MMKKFPLIFLTGETGSGKTTMIPQYVLEYFKYEGPVICTQPRKLAVSSIASYVSTIMDVNLGEEIGYRYKNMDKIKTSKSITGGTQIDSKLIFATHGILENEAYKNKLENYKAIIIDEAHDRNREIDMLLLFLKKMLEKKPAIKTKIIIMSATADIKTFQKYFKGIKSGLFTVTGRSFPIKENYLEYPIRINDEINEGLKIVRSICEGDKKGDILMFLAGVADLTKACKIFNEDIAPSLNHKVKCLQLSGSLSETEQNQITDSEIYKTMPGGPYERKLVMTTNVAEASVTVDGIVFLIDSGRAKKNEYDPRLQAKRLNKKWISKAEIKQRIGRAGRTQPGIAYHLYTKKEFKKFQEYPVPAILTEDLLPTCLNLLTMDIVFGFKEMMEFSEQSIDKSN